MLFCIFIHEGQKDKLICTSYKYLKRIYISWPISLLAINALNYIEPDIFVSLLQNDLIYQNLFSCIEADVMGNRWPQYVSLYSAIYMIWIHWDQWIYLKHFQNKYVFTKFRVIDV